MTTNTDLSTQALEATPGSHVYLPDLPSDYKSIHTGKIIKTIDNPNPEFAMEIINEVNLPPFCIATGNPGPGSVITIKYQARNKLLEVFTLEKYINSFIGHLLVRDVEFLTQEIARELATVLGQGLSIQATFELVGYKYGQAVHVNLEVTQEQAAKFRQEYPAKYQKYLEDEAVSPHIKKVAPKPVDPNATYVCSATQEPAPKVCPVTGRDDNPELCPALTPISSQESTVSKLMEQQAAKASQEKPAEQVHDGDLSKCPVAHLLKQDKE